MTGMGGADGNDPAIVHSFHQTLLHQGFVVAGLLLAVLVAWNILRARQLRRMLAATGATDAGRSTEPAGQPAEPAGRRFLRRGFGILWLLDGVLQAQAAMPQHLVPQVVLPAAHGSPGWVVDMVDSATTVWVHHPVTAAAATVWIQIGLGLWLLVAPSGRWSTAAGATSAVWGLVIWVFGEAFGSVLAPGLSWLEGAPGAALLYVAAGALIALPDNSWTGTKLATRISRVTGTALIAFAVLQAWPGRHAPRDLSGMAGDMAATPQPGWLHDVVRAVAGHAGAANGVAVVALLSVGAALVAASPGRPRVATAALAAAAALCLSTWVAVQDLGFLGGVGTDPNSMVPWLLLVAAGHLGMTRPGAARPATRPWRERMSDPAYTLRTVAAAAAVAVTLVGAIPMAGATARTAYADPARTADAPTGVEPASAVRSHLGCPPCTTSPGASTAR